MYNSQLRRVAMLLFAFYFASQLSDRKAFQSPQLAIYLTLAAI